MDVAPPSYHPSPRRPRLALPPGAVDAHCHVFGPQDRFPFAERRTFTPSDAPKELLFALHDRLGFARSVIVQSGCHGFDNSVVADAIAARPGRYKGTALLPPDTGRDEIARLDAAGFCGVRFNFMRHLSMRSPIEAAIAMGPMLADFGWHLQLHMEADLIEELAPAIHRAAVPVMIDHMGRVDASRGLDQPPFRALLALLEDDNVWVKVCGGERSSRQDPPWSDALPFARRLVDAFGDRAVWGTDWPHPNFRAAPPDDGLLVDLLAEIAPDAAARRALLVDNPQRFYRFTA